MSPPLEAASDAALPDEAVSPENPTAPAGRRRFPSGPLLRRIADLDEPEVKAEEVLCISGARVVFCDETLLVHDFPELAERQLVARDPALARLSVSARRQAVRRLRHDWLVWHAALISKSQAAATTVSTPIATHTTVTAYRPPRYGRALVTSLEHTNTRGERPARGLLDLKGAGVAPGKTPHLGAYGSGLSSLYRILSDTFYQWLLDEIFARAAPSLWTVPVYGVLDLGFDLLTSPPTPVGLQIRRAHRRPRSAIELPRTGSKEEVLKLEVELLLRHYGLTSCTQGTSITVGPHRGRLQAHHGPVEIPLSPQEEANLRALTGIERETVHFDGVNVQLTREVELSPPAAQLLDFGQYSVRDAFEQPLASLVRDRRALLGRIVWPDSPHYVQPDPRVRLPRERYACTATTRWATDLARRLRAGEIAGDDVATEIDERVRGATRAWGPLSERPR